jgi:hypothetical protein
VHALLVVIAAKHFQPARGVEDSRKTSDRGPRAGSANQPFDERMRDGGVGHRFNFLYVEYPQVDESNDITPANPRKTALHEPFWLHLRIRSPQADSLTHVPAPQRVARKRISVIGDGAAKINAMGEFGTSVSTQLYNLLQERQVVAEAATGERGGNFLKSDVSGAENRLDCGRLCRIESRIR